MTDATPTIVIFAGAPYRGVRRSARSISEALADHATVVYVDPSASSRGANGVVADPELTLTPEGVHHLGAVSLPAHTRPGMRTMTDRLMVRAASRALDRIGADRPTAVLLQTPQRNVLRRLDEAVSVYWATDLYAAGAALMGVDESTLSQAERTSATNADLIVAVSPAIAEYWTEHHDRVVEVGHGVTRPVHDRTDRPADLPKATTLAAIVGTLSPRIDVDLVRAVADSGIEVVLIGPLSLRDDRGGFDELLARDDVHWLGTKPHAELGDYYAHIDVGLVPYTLSAFNRYASPLKPLEYLAAGLPVVATPLPQIVALNSEDVTIAEDAAGFAEAAAAQAKKRWNPELIERRIGSTADMTWSRRAEEILTAIEATQDSMEAR